MTQHQTAEGRNRVERTGTIFVSDSVEMSVKAAFRFGFLGGGLIVSTPRRLH